MNLVGHLYIKNIKTSKMNYLITPSELDRKWFQVELAPIDYPRLLYLGERFKKRRGSFFNRIIPKFKIQI